MKTSLPSTVVASLLALAALTSTQAAVVTLEDFSGVTSGTLLSSVPSWSLQSGATDTATVTSTAGYQGGSGATITTQSQYKYAIPANYVMTPTSLTSGYSIKMQLTSNNNYQQAQVLLGKNDGVNGLAVVFDGGTANGDADNSIKISSGGTGWGSVIYTNYSAAKWASDAWYEITFSNIALTNSGYGPAVTGLVTITNLNTGIALLSDAAITGFGNSGTFNTLNTVLVGNKGTARSIAFDDVTATVPEPATWALLIPVLLITLLRRRTRAAV
ncbi:MAG: PEP-CTERM sorting domain-containing protein [Verrucomicrobia bacterium]|nr:PEP-CTERM sorting domain-containing protein [Verrucomicrobiota bacterium]